MDYQKVYSALILRGRLRVRNDEYYEKHHIIPKCMGGQDNVSNIVHLTPEEHFIAHQLLVKIYPTETKLILAMFAMTMPLKGLPRKNKAYGWIRKKHKEYLRNDINRKINLKEKLTGRKFSNEHKKKISESITARNNTVEWKDKQRKVMLGRKYSDEVNAKKGLKGKDNPMYGQTHSKEIRKIISDANKQKIVCPHCNKTGGISIMKRWHFNNCKSKV